MNCANKQGNPAMASEYIEETVWICDECDEEHYCVEDAIECCLEKKATDNSIILSDLIQEKKVYTCTSCAKTYHKKEKYCPECTKIEKAKLDEWNSMVNELENKNNPHLSGSV